MWTTLLLIERIMLIADDMIKAFNDSTVVFCISLIFHMGEVICFYGVLWAWASDMYIAYDYVHYMCLKRTTRNCNDLDTERTTIRGSDTEFCLYGSNDSEYHK